jgi:steroid delta-isomerase-like uncharacterized protein
MGKAREVMDQLTRAATEEHNVDAAVACYADEAVMITPEAGEIRGHDGIRDYWQPFFEAFPDAGYEPMSKLEAGDTAIDEGWFTGTHTGPLRMPDGETIPATGRRIRFRGCDLATVEGGKIKEHHLYYDLMQFMEQLGMAPPSEQPS